MPNAEQILQACIESLSIRANKETTLTWLGERSFVIGLFETLHRHGIPLNEADIYRRALACQYDDKTADLVAALAGSIGRGELHEIDNPVKFQRGKNRAAEIIDLHQ